MTELRRSKLESLLLHLLSQLISSQEIKDYRVGTDVCIQSVRVSRDGAYADIYVSSFQSAEHSTRGVEGLNSASGFIRRKLAPQLHLRQIPNFRFHADHSFQLQMSLQERLENLIGTPVNPENKPENKDKTTNENKWHNSKEPI